MTTVFWSPRASLDLDSIHEYVARDSAISADLVVQRLVHAVERLREFPNLGRVVPEVGQAKFERSSSRLTGSSIGRGRSQLKRSPCSVPRRCSLRCRDHALPNDRVKPAARPVISGHDSRAQGRAAAYPERRADSSSVADRGILRSTNSEV